MGLSNGIKKKILRSWGHNSMALGKRGRKEERKRRGNAWHCDYHIKHTQKMNMLCGTKHIHGHMYTHIVNIHGPNANVQEGWGVACGYSPEFITELRSKAPSARPQI